MSLYSEKGKRNITGRKARKRGGVSKFRVISRERVCVLVARDRIKQTLSEVSSWNGADSQITIRYSNYS